MTNPIIGLVFGNGIAIDFVQSQGSGDCPNPSYPFSWEFSVPSDDGLPWREAFPELAHVLNSLQLKQSHFPYTRILSELNEECRSFEARMQLEAEVRQFVVFAYSVFQQKLDRSMAVDWSWSKWIRQHAPYIAGVVSFNYDLIVETVLQDAGIHLRRPGIRTDGPGAFFMKPHGSIDFGCDPRIKLSIAYPLNNYLTRNDMGLVLLERGSLRVPRQEAFIVLPTETSPYVDYQWVAPGYNSWQRNAHILTHCIFAGLSYSDCDRRELDFLLEGLSPAATVIIANPSPPDDFRKKIIDSKRAYIEWRSGPLPLMPI